MKKFLLIQKPIKSETDQGESYDEIRMAVVKECHRVHFSASAFFSIRKCANDINGINN
jgi:hypothetical protein